eukprot:TRINITY_DN121125_c2_g1_i1.p1 TRINITY_DN121125_c2_g1~~TRINITY_DN121125_c2_g1_i1.p1  ORF type:complete len:539 (+),score=78.51 TRINITY_DN121125_c2_g1_i1:3152-4768(+)
MQKAMPQLAPLPPARLNKTMKIEEDIRKTKLKDMERIREELEQKLESVNLSVQMLRRGQSYSNIEERPKAKRSTPEESPEEFYRKRAMAQEFVQKMQKVKYSREQLKIRRHQMLIEKQRKEMEEIARKMKQQNEALKAKRKEEIAKLYQALRKKREVQQLEWERTQQNMIPKEDSYIHKKLEQKYERDVVLPLLEQRKADLMKRRNQSKLVTFQDLEEHKRIHDQKIQEREYMKQKEIEAKKQREKALVEMQKGFGTKISQKVKLMDEEKKHEKYNQWMLRKKLHQKMESYADIVNEVCKIQPNGKKAAELSRSIEKLKHPVRKCKDVKKEYSLANLNMPTRHIKKLKHSKSFQEYSPTPVKKINYLVELKRKRAERCRAQGIVMYDWNADLSNGELSPEEKYEKVVTKANLMEGRAKMKEQLLLCGGGSVQNLHEGEKVAELFLNAIKAKLAVLEHLQQNVRLLLLLHCVLQTQKQYPFKKYNIICETENDVDSQTVHFLYLCVRFRTLQGSRLLQKHARDDTGKRVSSGEPHCCDR